MNDCPPAEMLLYEDRIPGRLAEHVAQCEACNTIVTLKALVELPERPETRGSCDDAVLAMIASGITVVVAAGNGWGNGTIGADACMFPISNVPEAITVAASTPVTVAAVRLP